MERVNGAEPVTRVLFPNGVEGTTVLTVEELVVLWNARKKAARIFIPVKVDGHVIYTDIGAIDAGATFDGLIMDRDTPLDPRQVS